MNSSRFEETVRSLNGMAKKVLDATPIQAPWTCAQVCSEIRRIGSNAEHSVVMACLSTLVDRGLVRESITGQFIRVVPKARLSVAKASVEPDQADTEQHVSAPAAAPKAAPPQPDALSTLAALSGKVRGLAELAIGVATAIDDVALEVEERIQHIHADTAKLRQLQTILKSISA